MKRIIANMMLITIIAKLLGFAREILLSYCFGASGMADAYLISLTIPGTIFQFVGTGLSTCFIPVFLGILDKKGKEAANAFTNTVLSVILLFSTMAILVIWGWGNIVVKIFASGFTGTTLEYAVLFTKINIFSLYLSTFVYVFNSLLQSGDCFIPTSLAVIPNSIVTMISIILGAKINAIFLPVGSIAAVLIQLCCLLPNVSRRGFRLHLNMRLLEPDMKTMYHLILPVMVGVSVNEINVLVDKTVASNVAVGGISALSYAYSLVMFVQGIFAQTIATVYYPTITRIADESEHSGLQGIIEEAVNGMLFLLMPITAGCILLANPIINILYGRGAFDDYALTLTTAALVGYAVGILGYGAREILSRVFYALHDTKTPTRNAIIGMVINILMNIIFSRLIGIGGLALATSVSSIITSCLLLLDMKKRKLFVISREMAYSIGKMLIATIGMMGVVLISGFVLGNCNLYLKVALTVGISGFSYLFLNFLMKIPLIKGLNR